MKAQDVADAVKRLEVYIIYPEMPPVLSDLKLITEFVREVMSNGSAEYDEVNWEDH